MDNTVLVVPPNLVVNPIMYGSVPYDPFKISTRYVGRSGEDRARRPSIPASATVNELGLSQIRPVEIQLRFARNGYAAALGWRQFRVLASTLVHVPFSAVGPAIGSTVAGHTPIAFCSLPPVVETIKGGTLRALAVTAERGGGTAGVPSMSEAGYPDIEGEGWLLLLFPPYSARDWLGFIAKSSRFGPADVAQRIGASGSSSWAVRQMNGDKFKVERPNGPGYRSAASRQH